MVAIDSRGIARTFTGLLLCAALTACSHDETSPSTSEGTSNAVQPRLELLAQYAPGLEGDPALLTLRLINASARQELLDDPQAKPAKAHVQITPAQIPVIHHIDEEKTTEVLITNPVRLNSTRAEPSELDGRDVLSMTWQFDQPSSIEPGHLISVQLDVGKPYGEIDSNVIVAPSIPTKLRDVRRHRARTNRQTGNTDALQRIGQAMIDADHQDDAGYFYRGLAFEQAGNNDMALADYEKALELIMQKSREEPQSAGEPPFALLDRIYFLRELN